MLEHVGGHSNFNITSGGTLGDISTGCPKIMKRLKSSGCPKIIGIIKSTECPKISKYTGQPKNLKSAGCPKIMEII